MSRLQRIRPLMMSLRGGIAVVGALAFAASFTQVAGTLAAPDLTRTAKVPIASANYYPTPLTTSVNCNTKPEPNLVNYTSRRAEISWAPVSGATGYRMELVNYDNGSVWKTRDVASTVTSIAGISAVDPGRNVLYARVRTINGPAVSSGYTAANSGMSYKDGVSDRTECEKAAKPSLPNYGWENNQTWSPEVAVFRVLQPLVNDPRAIAAEVEGAEGALINAATLDDSVGEASTTATPTPESARRVPQSDSSTSTSASRSSNSTGPTTAPSVKSTTSSSSRSTLSTTTAPPASTTRSAATTSTTVPATASSVALPGGGEAEIVGGTTLVVSDAAGDVCTVKVRAGSTLKVRSGELEVTDAVETRVVDQETCRLT